MKKSICLVKLYVYKRVFSLFSYNNNRLNVEIYEIFNFYNTVKCNYDSLKYLHLDF